MTVQLYQNGSDYPYDMSWNAVPEGVRTIEEATRDELEKLDGVEQVSLLPVPVQCGPGVLPEHCL